MHKDTCKYLSIPPFRCNLAGHPAGPADRQTCKDSALRKHIFATVCATHLPSTLQGTLLGLLTASGAELSILQSANRVVAVGAAGKLLL